MKVSFTLILAALTPAAKAIDFFPNLRGIAVEVAEEAEFRGRYGGGCKGDEQKCSTAADSIEAHRCCKIANTKVLTCAKDSEPDAENPQFDGTCIESSGDRCFDFHNMQIVCEDDDGNKDEEKCANHYAAPLAAKAGCRIICNYNSRLEKHICVQGGGEEEVAEEEQ